MVSKHDNDVATEYTPGRSIEIRAESTIFRAVYHSRVIEYSNGLMRIEVPVHDGKLVLLPVGTSISLSYGGQARQGAVVVDRVTGHNRSLVLSTDKNCLTQQSQDSRVIAVSSGKGGVGKSTLTVNIAIQLAMLGKKVCLIDADLGMANVDVLLNVSTKWNLGHVVRGEKSIFEVLVEGPQGLVLLPGGSGIEELANLGEQQYSRLMEQFRLLEKYCDFVLIDTGAGVSKAVTTFLLASGEGIIVTTPEPHAITDAYGMIKVLSGSAAGRSMRLSLILNRTRAAEDEKVAERVVFACRRFLDMDVLHLGSVPEDDSVVRAIRKQKDFVSTYPRSKASAVVRDIAARLIIDTNEIRPASESRSGEGFWGRVVNTMRSLRQ